VCEVGEDYFSVSSFLIAKSIKSFPKSLQFSPAKRI